MSNRERAFSLLPVPVYSIGRKDRHASKNSGKRRPPRNFSLTKQTVARCSRPLYRRLRAVRPAAGLSLAAPRILADNYPPLEDNRSSHKNGALLFPVPCSLISDPCFLALFPVSLRATPPPPGGPYSLCSPMPAKLFYSLHLETTPGVYSAKKPFKKLIFARHCPELF